MSGTSVIISTLGCSLIELIRQFLKQTAFAATIPTIISSTALGAGDTPVPSERVNLGFIGVGPIHDTVIGGVDGLGPEGVAKLETRFRGLGATAG